ncbi:MAG: hypothetical protein HC897_19190 [Thermoanaerobaculia bacterium]|nr:hypothetical protein [Thermoanaerobaculia bacterium]
MSQIVFLGRFAGSSLRKWIGEEVGFTILPLIILALVLPIIGRNLGLMYTRPEWSFAAIVLFGGAIGRFIHLIDHKRSLPWKLNNTSRLLLLPMVLSVLVFSIGILHEQGAITINGNSLWNVQFLLFIFALAVSFLAELLATADLVERDHLPSWISRYRFYKHTIEALKNSRNELRYVLYALSKRRELKLPVGGGITDSRSPDLPRLETVRSSGF